MDDAARRELAERQAQLVRALAGAGPPPDGFDPARLRLVGQALGRKRLRTAARAWPALHRALGEKFAAEFALYARGHPLPPGGPADDALGFARHLAGRGLLPRALRWRLLLRRWLRPFRSGRPPGGAEAG